MKFDKLPRADVRETDKPAMREAIALLQDAGIDARRPGDSKFQLKLDQYTSYYPSKGTIYVDGADGPEPEKGISALKAWIAEHS